MKKGNVGESALEIFGELDEVDVHPKESFQGRGRPGRFFITPCTANDSELCYFLSHDHGFRAGVQHLKKKEKKKKYCSLSGLDLKSRS